MRDKLQALEGVRAAWSGTFERYGEKKAFRGPPIVTILLRHILDAGGNEVCDHLWFQRGKRFSALNLVKGDRVQFEATVTRYVKGYRGCRDEDYFGGGSPLSEDFKLARPNNFQLLGKPAPATGQEQLSLF